MFLSKIVLWVWMFWKMEEFLIRFKNVMVIFVGVFLKSRGNILVIKLELRNISFYIEKRFLEKLINYFIFGIFLKFYL